MADLIDRENTKAVLVDWFLNDYGEKRENGYRLNLTQFEILTKMKSLIGKIPQADTEQHAHWIVVNRGLINPRCSNCGEYSNNKTTYCAKCGCKMDEEIKEEHK